MKQFLLTLFATAGIAIFATAQTVGEYRSNSNNGNWTALSSWQRYNGGGPGGGWGTPTIAQGYPGQNAVPSLVTIRNNNTITLNVSPTNNIGALTIEGGNQSTTLNINAGFTLTVNGAITINSGTGNADLKAINVDGGTLNAASLIMQNVGGTDRYNIVRISNGGTVSITGNITMNGDENRNYIAFASTTNSTLNVGGALTGGSIYRNSNPAVYTVNFNGTVAQTIPVNGSAYTYYNIAVNNTHANGAVLQDDLTTTNLLNNITVGDINTGSLFRTNNETIAFGTGSRSLTVAEGSTMNAADGQISFGAGGGAKSVIINGHFQTADQQGLSGTTTTAISSTNNPTITLGSNSTIEYNRSAGGGGGTQTITDRNDYNNLIIAGNGTKTWTLAATRPVTGDITMAGSANFTIATSGGGTRTINLQGNWVKNSAGTFTQNNNSIISFSGNTTQDIGGTQSTVFNRIAFDNSFAGTAITISTATRVSGSATFTSGVVSTNSALLTFDDEATVSGASNASYVDGPVRKNGNNDFTFPIGDPLSGYHPIRINNEGGGNTNGFTATYFRGSANALGSPVAGLVVSACEYWTLDRNAGSSNPGVYVSWTPESSCSSGPYTTTGLGLVLANLSGSVWDHVGNGTKQPASGTYGVGGEGSVGNTGVSQFGTFVLGNIAPGENPLPVTFSDVKAYEKGTGVQVEWSNLTEKDVVNYVVERSSNGRDFTPISQHASRSNQNDKQSYTSFDASPVAGSNFYRIRVTEIDGKLVYSKLLRVDLGVAAKGFTLYPNPVVGNELSINFAAIKGQYTLRIINAAGQQVLTQKLSHPGGNFSQSISLPSVKAGFYTLQVLGDNYKESKIFVIQ